MNEDMLKFICFITGHDEETIKQMYNDWLRSPRTGVQPEVSFAEPNLSESAYKKHGEFETVGELKKLLEPFQDEMPIGFINQPKQDLYLSIDLEYRSSLGFQ